MTALALVALFWVAVIVLVAGTVFLMARLNVWGEQPVRSFLDEVGLLADVEPGAHRARGRWTR